MSKFSSRVNKLFLKTHFAISANEIKLLCDYYQSQLNKANVRPEDFSEEVEKIEELVRDKSLSRSERIQKFQAITKNSLVITAWQYKVNLKLFENHPNGTFVLKKTGEKILPILKEAKNYFQKIGS